MKFELMIDGNFHEIGVDIDVDHLMKEAKLNPMNGFDGIGILGDGQPIVCDRCGNFGWLDSAKYEVSIVIGVN